MWVMTKNVVIFKLRLTSLSLVSDMPMTGRVLWEVRRWTTCWRVYSQSPRAIQWNEPKIPEIQASPVTPWGLLLNITLSEALGNQFQISETGSCWFEKLCPLISDDGQMVLVSMALSARDGQFISYHGLQGPSSRYCERPATHTNHLLDACDLVHPIEISNFVLVWREGLLN